MRAIRWAVGMGILWVSMAVQAQDCREPGKVARPLDRVALGGRLYDNWWKTCGWQAPTEAHPSYPVAGKATGADTWRCKECHGWDYKGRDGAYAKGSHFTGITGIRAYAGRSEGEILVVLRNDRHRFDQVMPAELLRSLASFVARGQTDAGNRIDSATKQAQGKIQVGRRIYARQCVVCHGVEGRRLNFSHQADSPEFVGTIAVDNPWEMLHKIRNGQPGSVLDKEHVEIKDPDSSDAHSRRMREHMLTGRAMPSWRKSLSLQEQLDLLAFLQTLPVK